jgi:NADH dehydrogenase (ubiquinone) 1 alpha subcomplex subunit 6
MIREMPRALTMYDIQMDKEDSRDAIRGHFLMHKDVKDHRVRDMLVEKGYMELEETLMYYKQPSHLRELLQLGKNDEFYTGANRKKLGPDASEDDQYYRS